MTSDGADDQGPGRAAADLARQLREAADRLMAGWTRAPGATPPTLPGPLVPPATMSAGQLQAVLDDISARRAQLKAMQAQLGAFDEQLGALEASLVPLRDWVQAWARVEGAVIDPWRPPA